MKINWRFVFYKALAIVMLLIYTIPGRIMISSINEWQVNLLIFCPSFFMVIFVLGLFIYFESLSREAKHDNN